MRTFALAAAMAGCLAAGTAQAGDSTHRGVSWTWGDEVPQAGSLLVRSASGLTATFNTAGLTPGNAVTLWFIVFNNPAACYDGAGNCTILDLMFNFLATEADFHFGGGNVVGAAGMSNFAGHLNVGDELRSGSAEFGYPAVPLSNPAGADVLLALHSHGPKQTGTVLKAQLSSFLGGCGAFVGDAFGWATGPGDLALAPGECSTVQVSYHAAP